MENDELKKTLESLLFITDHPLPQAKLIKVTGVSDGPRIAALIAEIAKELDEKGSALQVLEVADGYQMATRSEYAPFIRKLFAERMTMRLSTAALETLSIVAYKQPLTRAEIESIRGVEVIAALESLLDKRLIKVVGRKETVGRPLMYGTTSEFMRHFGLKSLEDLPALESFAVESAPEVQTNAGPFVVLEEPAAPAVDAPAEAVTEMPAEASPEAAAETPPAETVAVPSDENPSSGQ